MQVTARQQNRSSPESYSRNTARLQNLSDLTTIPVEHLVNRHRLAPSELYHFQHLGLNVL
jgi:hypothetical protein